MNRTRGSARFLGLVVPGTAMKKERKTKPLFHLRTSAKSAVSNAGLTKSKASPYLVLLLSSLRYSESNLSQR